MKWRFTLLMAMGLVTLSCAAPVATTAVALGVAAHERSAGRCVAACTPGHVCNPGTGLCDPIPCAKGCPGGSSCVSTSTGSRCEPSGTLMVSQPAITNEGGAP